MGNLWSAEPHVPSVRYDVVLPTGCRAWELLYSGDINTWDAVAARYGMDKHAYCCGISSCDREAVCLRYVKATLKSNNSAVTIERYKSPTVQVPTSTCPDLKSLLSAGFRLNEVAAAQRGHLLLLVIHRSPDLVSQVAFPLMELGSGDEEAEDGREARRESDKPDRPRLFRRLSSKKDRSDGKSRRLSSSGVDTKRSPQDNTTTTLPKSASSDGAVAGAGKKEERCPRPTRCVGVIPAPHKDMTVISCHISPDLSRTAVLLYSLSPDSGTFCYTLHCFDNAALRSHNADKSGPAQAQAPPTSTKKGACPSPPDMAGASPYLVGTVKISREVQPYLVYDPRYGASRLAVANYEIKDETTTHELVVLSLEGGGGDGERQRETKVVKRGKLSLPAMFGNSRFNLLYSKDGGLIILQKLTDDRFGVTSYCDIYIFHSDDLTLIKYMTAALPGLFHICKVSYEPVFSRCGSFMRILSHHVSNGNNSDNNDQRGGGGGRGEDSDGEYTTVNIYQLPRSLSLMSQCRTVVLQHVASCRSLLHLPLPRKLQTFLSFGPVYC